MSESLEERDGRLGGFVDHPRLVDYAPRYAQHFVVERTGGVAVVRMHTAGQSAIFSRGLLNAWGQLLRDIGSDRENEVLVLTGTGTEWIGGVDPESFAQPMSDWSSDVLYEQYADGLRLLERLAFDIEIPTIAAINGPGPRLELGLMCDLTICSPTVLFGDGNFLAGSVPGDGMHLVLRELLGPKRAAQAVYTGETIDAELALSLGLINEVVPADRVLERAREIAGLIMSRPRTSRRLTHFVIQRGWQKRVVEDLRAGYAQQILAGSAS